jgi:hypothetical protein
MHEFVTKLFSGGFYHHQDWNPCDGLLILNVVLLDDHQNESQSEA